MQTIIENKLHYNKEDQRYECERIYQDAAILVARYISDRPYEIAGRLLPAGSCTLAVYRQGSRFVFWKMMHPDGELQGYLVHLCEPIELGTDEVTYRDLMLDLWQTPPEQPILLDEQDLADALAAGQIDPLAAAEASGLANQLLDQFPRITTEAEKLLSDLASTAWPPFNDPAISG